MTTPDVPEAVVHRSSSAFSPQTSADIQSSLKTDDSRSYNFSPMSHFDVEKYVGGRGTFISDDAIEAAIRMMKVIVEQDRLPIYVGNFLPSEQQVSGVISGSWTFLPEDKESINILLDCQALHWVTVSFHPGSREVLIYDSLKNPSRPKQLFQLLQKMYQGISFSNVKYIPITQQSQDDPACGAFAVACAFSKLLGHNPEDQEYIVNQMRKHFKECLVKGKLIAFPTKVKTPVESKVPVKVAHEICPEKETDNVSHATGLVANVTDIELKISSSPSYSRPNQLDFEISIALVSCKYLPKKLNKFLRIVCGLVNSMEGGQVRIRNLDFNQTLDGPPGIDDFHQKTDENLRIIISGTGTQYADIFKWKWQDGKGEYLILNVRPVGQICAVDFRTKSSLTKGREREDRHVLISLLKTPTPETYKPEVPTWRSKFILNAIIPTIYESVQVQLKHYQGCKTDDKLESKLEDDLRGYLSAFSKINEGGQVFIGLDEVSEKECKWEKGSKKGSGKQTKCKGQVIDNMNKIRKYIEYLVFQRMYWLRSDGTVAGNEDIKKYVWTTFHPVLSPDGHPLDGVYVIEISVAKFYGIVFTSKEGPEAMKVSTDGTLYALTVEEWYAEMLRKGNSFFINVLVPSPYDTIFTL